MSNIQANDMSIPGSSAIKLQVYSPRLLAICSVVANAPLAIFLYGINITRRGSKTAGIILKTISALAIVFMTIASAFETRMKSVHFMLFGIAVGMTLFNIEKPHYKKAISQGAMPAPWWPPFLFAVVQAAAAFAISYFYDSN